MTHDALLSTLVHFCMHKHWPAEATFRRAGLDLTELRLAQRPLHSSVYLQLLISMATQHDCPTIALELGCFVHSEHLGLFGALIASSADLQQAVQRFSQFKPLLDMALDLQFDQDEQGIWLRYLTQDQSPIGQHRYYTELLLSALLTQGQQFIGQSLQPLQVQFAHAAPAYQAHYATVFACPIRFATDHAAILLPNQISQLPFITASQRFHQHLLQQAQAHCPTRSTVWRDELAQYLLTHLAERSACQLAQIARHFGRSSRAIQRQLQSEHTSLQQVLDQVRQQQALHLLQQHSLPIEQIALMLGFAYPSSFNARFLAWTGQTPTAYRQQASTDLARLH